MYAETTFLETKTSVFSSKFVILKPMKSSKIVGSAPSYRKKKWNNLQSRKIIVSSHNNHI